MNVHKQSKFLTLITLIVLVSMLLVPTGNIRAQSPQHPAPAAPFEGETTSGGGTTSAARTPSLRSATSLSVFQNGAARLTATQNSDGGWGWPLTGASALNTIQPIAQGLAEAYTHTMDLTNRAALLKAGTYLLAKTNNFSAGDGILAAKLDSIFGGNTYTSFVKTNFYDKLAAGTYDRNGVGTLYTAASFASLILTARTNQGIVNLAAWDIALGLVGAASVGADTAGWVTGTENAVNALVGNSYYDVLGLAGAVYGLAYVGEDFDPTTGQHAAASSTADLGSILASYQISSGGYSWLSSYISVGNECIQETAYAILALDKLNRTTYLTNITNAATYIASVPLGTGGWEGDPINHDGENNEITGEALWSLSVGDGGYPLSDIWVCPSGDCGHPGASTNSIQAAIDAVGHSTINIAAGTYTENIVVDKTVEIIGAGQGVTIIEPAISNPNCGGAGGGSLCTGGSNVFLIQADNVIIHDLTVEGDNPNLTTGFDEGGANIDARNGIITNHALGVFNGLEVYNVTVQNIYLRGMYASSGGTFNFHDNTVTNVQAEYASIAMFAYGGGPRNHGKQYCLVCR